MKKNLMRTLAASAMTAALGLTLMGAPAQAATRPVDVTKYTMSDVTYSKTNAGCHYTPVKATVKKNKKSIKYYYINAKVTGPGRDPVGVSFRNDKSKTTLQTCSSVHGTGKFKIGPATVSAYTGDYRYSWTNKSDKTSKTFYVRGKGYASLSAKRSGKNVTFKTAAKYYSPKKFDNLAYNPKSAKIQVKRSGKWATLKTVSFKGGKATVKATMKSTSPAQFRLTFPKTSNITGSTTKVLKK